MSRFRKGLFKKARRYSFSVLENNKEFSKGKKRTYPPGQHGQKRQRPKDYKTQLFEKQKVRFLYGMTESQLRLTFVRAAKQKGVLGDNFLFALESRLDNLVFRLGFAPTRAAARQLVNHQHVLVNEHVVDIPSYEVSVGDQISLQSKAKTFDVVKASLSQQPKTLPFVALNRKAMTGTYVRLPKRNELNQDINEVIIVEWYNRLL